jgi:hypothetical protein
MSLKSDASLLDQSNNVSDKSLIRPVVTYGCEAWTLTNRGEQHLRIFERRILRKIFDPVQNEDGSWRIIMNYELIGNADIVRFIKSRRI